MDRELEKNYDNIVKQLYLKKENNYHILKTVEGNEFKVIKSSQNNIVVIPLTDIATPMTISKYEVDLYIENGKGNFDSYTKMLLPYIKGDKSFNDVNVINNSNKIEKKFKEVDMKTKNIMLYGAPGVGKTHNYRRLITMIEDGNDEKTIFDFISKNETTNDFDNSVFEDIKKEKRIEFVTFHQSYSYEDFIEGFRPSENNHIELEDGIFKLLCNKALNNTNKHVASNKLVFSDAFELLLKDIENGKKIKINLKKENSFFEIYDYNKRTIYYTRQGNDKEEKYHTLSISTLRQMYEDESNIIITGGLKNYYEPLLIELLKVGRETKIVNEEQKNFYIVIDEINRGNISKIFGELITLIEEDKRDTYEVTLPYSKENFKIPSNLYIIATMNSTDKSIATIDIALRRRFTFLKMKPNLDLVKNEKAKDLMKKLNDHISNTINEDYQLGHSYLMKIIDDNDLEFVKEYKIKPLLQEYFYGDEKNFNEAIKILG